MTRSEDSIRLEALGNLFYGAEKVNAEMDRIRAAEQIAKDYAEGLAERHPVERRLRLAVVSVFEVQHVRGDEPSIPWPATEEQAIALVRDGYANPDERHTELGRKVYAAALWLDKHGRYDVPYTVRGVRIALLTQKD